MRFLNGTSLIVIVLTATLGALVYPMWSYADRAGSGMENVGATQWGPLTAADRDFLVKVRQAGLWELPAGLQAIQRAPTLAIREAGDHLVVGHTDLDRRCRDVAAKLGVPLPDQPSPQQQAWLAELNQATGVTYQEKFATLLRMAHGKVFSIIAGIRNSTRNALIRRLADAANVTVLDHITMLEKTGMVNFDEIAREAAKDAAKPAAPPQEPPPGSNAPVPVVAPPWVATTSQPPAPPESEDEPLPMKDTTKHPEAVTKSSSRYGRTISERRPAPGRQGAGLPSYLQYEGNPATQPGGMPGTASRALMV